MFVEREEAIRGRAHAMWLGEGQPHGRALDHWLAAQREHADAAEVAQPWFSEASGDETIWMRRVLWTPQPYAASAG